MNRVAGARTRATWPVAGRRTLGTLLAATVVLAAAACGDSEDDGGSKGGVVTISVNALPPETEQVNRKNFMADVAEFERLHPNIKIKAEEGKAEPATFQARLAGGQLPDVFYVYFTDPASIMAKKQSAEITPYLKDFPTLQGIKPDLMRTFTDSQNKVFGVPFTNYTMGLIYNRTLFQQAGLDPDKPPATWEELRDAAKKITALGNGNIGYADYSKSNTGGWHFTAELYGIGGEIAKKDGDTWKAAFNDDKGKQVLQTLKDMRWTDNTMGSRQALEYADLLTMFGSGKLGMYIAAPDNIPTLVKDYKGNYENIGLGAMPGGKASLGGGEGFMFKAGSSAEKIKAGLTWVNWMYVEQHTREANFKRMADNKEPVGLPQPNLFTTELDKKQQDLKNKYANVPAKNYASFLKGAETIQLKLEPPNAQQIYAVLDTAMLAVLTQQNADVGKLLADAEKQVNTILATVPK